MSSPTTIVALLLLAYLATAHTNPIKESQFEERLNNLHMSGPGRLTHLNPDLNKYMVRHVRKDSSKPFEAYITFKNKPPITLVTGTDGELALECEVSGSVYPRVYWMQGHKRIIQGPQIQLERKPNQLGLTMVKSRLYLACANNTNQISTFRCMAETELETIRADALVSIKNGTFTLEHSFHNKAAEKYENENSIDYDPEQGLDINSYYPNGKARSSCLGKRGIGSPARIYLSTLTTLENIGSNSIIRCSTSGIPRPTVTWYDSNNDEIVPDYHKYQLLSTGDLLIKNITFDDMGKYRCSAMNRFGHDAVDKIFFYPTDPNPELER